MMMLEKAFTADISHEMFTIYTRSTPACPFCERAKAKLKEIGQPYDERDILRPLNREELLTRFPGARTVPQIFLGDIHIGGCDDLVRLSDNKDLDNMIAAQTH